jgi:5-formyltetrahydrofolate cyclo-ligase
MLYVSTKNEVETKSRINELLANNKRIILPYCKNTLNELGMAEIKNIEQDTLPGMFGILEPVERVRDNFFKSDLQLIVCPAIAFDIYANRLGNGKGYFDTFLKEIKNRTPVFGIAFDCQIYQENLPFDYHDVSMDQVITESGLLINKEP